VPVDGARLARLAGQYLDPARDRTMQIVARGSTLVVGDVVFAPTTATTFANDSAGRLDFELDDNRVRRLTTSLLGIRTAWSPAPRTAPSAEELRIYEGSYASAELGVDYVVRITEGHLEIGFDPRRGRLPFAFVFDRAEPLAPRYPDGFQVGDSGITLRFVRDRDRKVRGLRLFMERARNLEFVRVP
jgi:hypothetical protein